MDDTSHLFPRAEKKKINADIVICLDVTGSMQLVIDAWKQNLKNFVDTLQKEGQRMGMCSKYQSNRLFPSRR